MKEHELCSGQCTAKHVHQRVLRTLLGDLRILAWKFSWAIDVDRFLKGNLYGSDQSALLSFKQMSFKVKEGGHLNMRQQQIVLSQHSWTTLF